MSHSRAWRRGRRGGAAVVACVTVFFFNNLAQVLEWLTVLLQGYIRPYRQYGEGAPVTWSPPKVFTKHKYVYIIPTTSPYYNNPQALFNLYKPAHTPQPMHTSQRTSSTSTTTSMQSSTTYPQSTATSMSISSCTPRSSWKPLPPPPLPQPDPSPTYLPSFLPPPLPLHKPSPCLSTNPFSSLTTDPLPPSSTSHVCAQPAAHSPIHLPQKSLPSTKPKSSFTTKNLDPRCLQHPYKTSKKGVLGSKKTNI